MLNKKITSRLVAVILTGLLFLTVIPVPAFAAYKIAFATEQIQITSPSVNNTSYDKVMTVEGTSTQDRIWLCLRGPKGEVTVYPVEVKDGSFQKKVWLRFGPGKYTVWAGLNPNYFDGKIRFEVLNSSEEDYFNLTPSGYVESESQVVQKIVDSLITENMSELEKAKAIHDWVIKNIAYDAEAYYNGDSTMKTATETISSKKGVCRDYSFVFASLARAAGIPTRVVYGEAWNNAQQTYEKHAWNEALVDGKWISIDTTWDAGYVKNKKFVIASSDKYFNVDQQKFKQTHKVTSVTLY
ncbi:MAG: transglutaminase domain-containing protein [Peptococcaceae bacterium]|nr:transglutaminase domain-containing protein [Peptococcaceae bacterium]